MKFPPKGMRYFDTAFMPAFFGFTTDPKAFAAEMKRLDVNDPQPFTCRGCPATTHTLERTKGLPNCTCIVTLDLKATRGLPVHQLHALLAHEATHVWQNIRESMGVKTHDHEIEAYAIQWFTQCMIKELRK